MSSYEQIKAAARRAERDQRVAALRDGVRPPRAAKFRSPRDYRRTPKHRGQGWS